MVAARAGDAEPEIKSMETNRQTAKVPNRKVSWIAVLLLMLMALIVTGCASDSNDTVADESVIEGPAFVLFFTDP